MVEIRYAETKGEINVVYEMARRERTQGWMVGI